MTDVNLTALEMDMQHSEALFLGQSGTRGQSGTPKFKVGRLPEISYMSTVEIQVLQLFFIHSLSLFFSFHYFIKSFYMGIILSMANFMPETN